MADEEGGDGKRKIRPVPTAAANAGGNASWLARLALVGLVRRRR